MLPVDLKLWQPEMIVTGLDILYDATSIANYTFLGFALLGTAQSAASWTIIVYKINADGSAAAERHYPPDQQWSTRTGLSLP